MPKLSFAPLATAVDFPNRACGYFASFMLECPFVLVCKCCVLRVVNKNFRWLCVPLSDLVPRLWAFLYHPSSSVRKATVETLVTLTKSETPSWVEPIIGDALKHIYQRCLLEHIPEIIKILPMVRLR